jgi:predicted dehydrogenase
MAQAVEVGQVGLGDWGKNLLRNFTALNNCHVKMACDANKSTCAKISESNPEMRITSRFEDILEDNSIQAVIIATPPALHYDMAMKCLKAGKDVFVEKPLVLDLAHGKDLVELADKNERVLMVGHIMLYHPVTLFLKKYIQDGVLGDIYYLYSQRINLGKVRDIENALWSFAPHDISMIMFLLDKFPVKASAVGSAYLQKNIQDVCFITLHFADRIMAHIHVSWLDPHKERKITIVGSKKMAVFDDAEPSEKVWLYDKGVDARMDYATYGEYLNLRIGDITLPRVPSGEPLKQECTHFLNCVINRERPRSDGRNGLKVLAVLQAAQNSLELGGTPVDVQNTN